MHAILSVSSLLLGVIVILAGNGLIGTLLGVRGQMEQISASTLGVIMSGYFMGYLLGTFQVPRMIRRAGHIRSFAALASVASVVVLLHGLYVHAALWFALRAVSGFCIVGLYIVIESWLNERTSNAERGHVFSAYMTSTLIGLGAGQLMLMAGDVSRLELFAVGSVLLSIGLVPVALTRVREPTLTDAHRLGLRKLFRISPLGFVACVCSGLGTGAFWGLGPVFAAEVGLDTRGIAVFMSLTILGGILMLWPMGRLSDRFERRKILALVCALTSCGALLCAIVMGAGADWMLIGGFAYGAFAFSIYSLATAHTSDHLEPEHMLEAISSLQLSWACGAILGPILAGALMQQFAPAALMAFIAVSSAVPAVYALYRMRVRASVPIQDQGEFVPQFATSPAALEMHPDSESDGRDDGSKSASAPAASG